MVDSQLDADSEYEIGRRQKQVYLWENVVNLSYDTGQFAYFVEQKKVDGTNVDNWTFEELQQVVYEFQQAHVPVHHYPDQPTEQVTIQTEGNDDLLQQQYAAYNNNFDDCPKVETREFISTKAISEDPSILNFKKVVIKVTSNEVKKGGFFSSDFAQYAIETDIHGMNRQKVFRQDKDFYITRKLLRNQFPYILLPPIPIRAPKLVEKSLFKRQKKFQRFLQAISRSEQLKASKFMVDFLTVSDRKEWEKIVKNQEKMKFSRNIADFITQEGQADVQINQNSSVFCSKMMAFIDSYQTMYTDVIKITEDVHVQSLELAQTLNCLTKSLESLSELNRMIKCDRMSELYGWLSRMLTGTGQHVTNTSELIKLYCGNHLKYHMQEHEAMRELFKEREAVKYNFTLKERALFEKKEKLFKQRQIVKWQCTAVTIEELTRRQEELFQNKEKAFKFMLTEETKQLNDLREELSFWTNQCLDEVRRVTNDNGVLLTDHFITMSQIECAYINQHHVMWADFMKRFANTEEASGASYTQKLQQHQQKVNYSQSLQGAPQADDKKQQTLQRQLSSKIQNMVVDGLVAAVTNENFTERATEDQKTEEQSKSSAEKEGVKTKVIDETQRDEKQEQSQLAQVQSATVVDMEDAKSIDGNAEQVADDNQTDQSENAESTLKQDKTETETTQDRPEEKREEQTLIEEEKNEVAELAKVDNESPEWIEVEEPGGSGANENQ